jgi:hypothetical protein
MKMIVIKPEERKQTENVKQNLEYIQKSVLNGTHKEQSAILSVIVAETFEVIKNMKFFYEVPFSNDKNTNHFYTYSSMGKTSKAKLLADLEEIQNEISKRNTNTKHVLILIQSMLQTNLYKDGVQASINKWVNTSNFTTRYQLIYV